MPVPATAAMPPNLDLDSGYTIRVTALDPTTGASVAGVVLTNVIIMARNMGASDSSALATGPWLLVPGSSAA